MFQDGSRSYIASRDGKWVPISLPKKVVDGLIAYNTGGFRNFIQCDKKFVKILMVTCIGMHTIQSKAPYDPLKMEFIKGKFAIYFVHLEFN